MKFSSYLNPDYIFPCLEVNSKEEIIRTIVDKVAEDNKMVSEQKNEIIKNILKREEEISTCIGNGIFLPHTRMIDFSDFIIAVATIKNKLEGEIGGTNQIDDIKVVFLIISDVLKNKNLLKAMSVISKIGLKQPEVIEKIKKSKDQIKTFEQTVYMIKKELDKKEAERFERKELKSISYTIYENKEVILFLNPNLDFFNRNLSEKSQYKIDFALSIKDTQNKYFLSNSVEYNTFIKMLPKDSYRYIDARRILVKPLKKEDIYLLSKKCYKEFIRLGGKNDRNDNWRCYWKFL